METLKKSKTELKEIQFCIAVTHLLLFLYNKVTIQVTGLLIATFWSVICCYFKGNLTAAPVLFAAMLIFVKYFWIPGLKIEANRKEMTEDLQKFRIEKAVLKSALK